MAFLGACHSQTMPHGRRRSHTVLLALLTTVAATPVSGQLTVSAEQVKAAYLYNFASFATWPAHAFEAPDSPFRVCIDGDLTGAGAIERTFQGEAVAGHRVTVIRNPATRAHRRCHILFVSGRAPPVEALLKGVAGAPVLTIGDGGEFIARGGMLELVMDAKHIRFDVNLRAASEAGVALSARLLQVARRVLQ